MGAAITLRNIVCKTQNLFVITIIPLHRYFYTDLTRCWPLTYTHTLHINNTWMYCRLVAVDVLNKSLHTTGKGKIFLFATALVDQSDPNPVI